MPDQDQNHDAHQGPLENDGPAYGREGRDSVYLAALKKTALAAAIAAVGFTVIVYLLMGGLSSV